MLAYLTSDVVSFSLKRSGTALPAFMRLGSGNVVSKTDLVGLSVVLLPTPVMVGAFDCYGELCSSQVADLCN